jgi:hypothetical protein
MASFTLIWDIIVTFRVRTGRSVINIKAVRSHVEEMYGGKCISKNVNKLVDLVLLN